MAERVVIDQRFRGPPESANGGYACGAVASFVDAAVVQSTLRVPPPLDRPLDVAHEDGARAELRDSGRLVAEARAVESLELAVPAPPSFAEAEAAAAASPWIETHPYPGCFSCGPARQPPDGLHNVFGPVPGREIVADGWAPDRSVADEDGVVDPRVVWSALDCPTGHALWFAPPDGPVLLGRLTAELARPVEAERRYVTIGWLRDRDGRKHEGASAIVDAQGAVVARAVGLWIELRRDSAEA